MKITRSSINEDRALDKIKANMHSTHNKDFEAIAAGVLIFNALKLKLNFVTQQPILDNNKKLYLIDIYFPDIGLAVECDEAHHDSQVDKDAVRAQDIISINSCTIMRINARSTADNFVADIESVIAEMQTRKQTYNNGSVVSDHNYETETDIFDEFKIYAQQKDSQYYSDFGAKFKKTQSSSIRCALPNNGILELTILNSDVYVQFWFGKNDRTDANVTKIMDNLVMGYDFTGKVFGNVSVKPNNAGLKVTKPGAQNVISKTNTWTSVFDWLIDTSKEVAKFFDYIYSI